MGATSGSDYWTSRLKEGWGTLGRSAWEGFKHAGPLGLVSTGAERIMTDSVGVLGRFGSGLIKGTAGVGWLHDKTTSWAAAHGTPGMMFGRNGVLGGSVANFAHGAGQTIGGGIYGAVGNWGKFIGGMSKGAGTGVADMSKWIAKTTFTDAGEKNIGQLFGKRLKHPVAGGLYIAPLVGGLGKGMFGYWDEFAKSKAINGPMDDEGVDLAPGAVNPSYSPLLPRVAKNKRPDNMGASGEIVFASHAARKAGWLGR